MSNFHLAGDKLQNYNDLSGLQSMKTAPKDEALMKAAREFESMFVNLMLKNMRSANKVFEEGGLFESKEGDMYRDMFDQQLALNLAHGKGIGIAESLYRQMQSQYGDKTASQSELKAVPMRRDISKPAAPVAAVVNSAEKTTEIGSPAEFIEAVLPMAKAAAARLGLDPLVLVAQSALETGWGRHILKDEGGQSSNNLFNIKAHAQWSGPTVEKTALEYREGRPLQEKSSFRQYESFAASCNDFVDFLRNNPRYQSALDTVSDARGFISELARAGYATDPNYANKVTALFESLSERFGQ